MIRVIVADDHAVVRTGLQLIFDETEDLSVEGEASNGDELLNKITEGQYDAVILDLLMPGKDSIDTLIEIKAIHPKLPVVIFTMNHEESYAFRLFRNGADAYIAKESDPSVLIQAIRSVVKGKKYYTPDQVVFLKKFIDDHINSNHLSEQLTDREFQVLSMLASGTKKDEIALKLNVSKNTISNHRNNILRKLELQNNSELTRYAIKKGIINF
jgi:DNA-binding NarL/FixJ family response regulator